jgi:hypothetical protein
MKVDEVTESSNPAVFHLLKSLYALFERVIDHEGNRKYATIHFSFFQNQVCSVVFGEFFFGFLFLLELI